jgi:hypothetical protein
LGSARRALGSPGQNRCRFLFLNAEGGWDPLAVFAPAFSSNEIQMEANAEPWSVGGLSLVDSPLRPVTRSFFERRAGEVAVLNGVSTRSVNHETCQIVALTGATSEDRPDWATILGYESRDENSLPHLVVSGPAFTGPYAVFVSNARGLLQPTIDGTLLLSGDVPLQLPKTAPAHVVDRFLRQRGAARAQVNPESKILTDYEEALARAKALTDSRLELRLVSGVDFAGRLDTAVAALSTGVCRCATVGTGFAWDTHTDNSLQSGLFENFFADLDRLLGVLAITPGPEGVPLAEDTVIVVTSEMGRTPAFNATGGRDHWPYTSMMVMGPGVSGGVQLGGYSDLYTGIGLDEGGDLDPQVPGITTESLGASLLVLGDVDPEAHIRSGILPIPGLLA